MATLKEIADRTGYSITTISRILNGDPSLSVQEETRRKVLEEAANSSYASTRDRRGRKPKHSLRLVLLETFSPAEQLNDPFYLYLSNYVRQHCIEHKFICIPLYANDAPVSLPDPTPVDGIIATGRFTPALIRSMAEISPNIVFLDCSPFESLYDSVVLGFELGVSLALDHLIENGHRRIGYIGPVYTTDGLRRKKFEQRRKIFIDLMKQKNLFVPDFLIDGPTDLSSTVEAIQAFLDAAQEVPTAFLCHNEEIAIGAVHALRARGYAIPKDISIVSFNDTPKSTLVDPPLTSVSTHVEEMAKTALRLIAERAEINGQLPVRTLPLKVIVPPSLIVRQSTGKAKDSE